MIHVATVHFESARWIDIQLRYLHSNLSEPFEVWASLEDVPGDHAGKFDRVIPSLGPHAGKLNLLGAEIVAQARPDDIIVFLDGDAFPIADPLPTIREALDRSSLVAVRRDENATDRQPHPCFCAVTVSEWERLRGDWSPGYCWKTTGGEMATDVGGNLLRSLERVNAQWTPLVRTNRVNLHPLWFGVYGGIVYHHGAGFRWAVGRIDLLKSPRPTTPGRDLPVIGRMVRRFDRARMQRFRARTAASSERLRDNVLQTIEDDPEFYRQFV